MYEYDAINRVTEIHRPNGISTYPTYNARDQIVTMKNLCDDRGWVVSRYDYTYDDRGFITGETAMESLYGYVLDDKHDGRHENWHDELYPHGDKHSNKHDKDAEHNYQIIETKRSFTYDDDGRLLTATENEERQGTYVYRYTYDDMGNRLTYEKTRNGSIVESAEYTYNASNQLTKAKLYDGKKETVMDYAYDGDGNLVSETGRKGTDKVELTYTYTVENRLKAVHDAHELLAAMAYDGDGNRIFQLNYNLHTDDDWKNNSGNGNGSNKDNTGSGNSSAVSLSALGLDDTPLAGVLSGLGSEAVEENSLLTADEAEALAASPAEAKLNENGNNGNTNNTEGSQNQSGILMPQKPVSEIEQSLIDEIRETGHYKNYELIEYVNDVNRENTEVLMEANIDGAMDTAYTYGNERIALERFTGWTGYYTYDPRGSVSGVTDSEGKLWKSYRYSPTGDITFGKPQYNNSYSYNAEDYNPNLEVQYLRARYYDVERGNFLTEDPYLGKLTDPLSLNRYNYVKSSEPNYVDPSGYASRTYWDRPDFLANYTPTQEQIHWMVSQGTYDDYIREYKAKQAAGQIYDDVREALGEQKANDYLFNLVKQAQKMNEDYFDNCGLGFLEYVVEIPWDQIGRIGMDGLQIIGGMGVVAIGLTALASSGGALGAAAAALMAGNAVNLTGIAGTLATFLCGLGNLTMGTADLNQGLEDLIRALQNDPEHAGHMIIDKLQFFQDHPWAYALLETAMTMGASYGQRLIQSGKMPVVDQKATGI